MQPVTRDAAIDAWLGAIAADGWRDVRLERAAEMAGTQAELLIEALGDQMDALAAFQDRIAGEAALGSAGGAGSVRDRLFDGLMRGFDALQAQRAAMLAIWRSRDPGVALLLAGRARLHLRRLAIASGIDVAGVRGELRLAALGALCLKAFQAWIADDSPDMGATMAELDRLLERAERAETEGVSPDLLGLPGLSSLLDRLPGSRGRADRARPPSPDLPAE